MTDWEQFEIDCTNYLKKVFGDHATFKHIGSSDSTKSDILVTTKQGRTFFIEAKKCPSQGGQFVLFPDKNKKKFEYSSGNNYPLDKWAKKIMEHMNNDIDLFASAGTTGVEISINEGKEIFSNWITSKYKDMGVKLIMTNGYQMFYIQDFKSVFDVSAKYRVKKSGSSHVGKKYFVEIKNFISKHCPYISDIKTSENKLFVVSDNNIHKKKFIVGKYTYMFALVENKFYEVRKLSNTNNANVIFSLNLKDNLKPLTKEEIVKYIDSYKN